MERKIVERLRLGAGVNEICRDLGVGKKKVRKTRELATAAGYLNGACELPAYPEALFPDHADRRSLKNSNAWRELEPHLSWIKERLDGGWHAVTVYEELPVTVPRSCFYRFLGKHHLSNRTRKELRVVPEIVHTPGEALLVDWGHLWTLKDEKGKSVKLWGFVGVLGYSRQMVVTVMTCCDQAHTLEALRQMYETFGGVPRRTTSDNPKVFALKADKYEPTLHPVYERFASHYGTVIECLPPSAPEKKGKVERPMPYVRRLLEAYAGDKGDREAVQKYLDQKLEIANQRRHGTTNERPVDRFQNEERAALKALPVLSYDLEHYHEGKVRRDGHVRFLGKYYSVSEEFIARDVTVIGNSRQVVIYCQGKLIETHQRVTDRAVSKSTKPHHMKPWEQVCNNHEGLRVSARKIGTCVEQVITKVLLKGDGFVDYRRIWGILSLIKKYSADEIDSACEEALLYDNLSYRAIKGYLVHAKEAQALAALTQLPEAKPAGRFQRDLTEYSQILLNLGTTKGDAYEH